MPPQAGARSEYLGNLSRGHLGDLSHLAANAGPHQACCAACAGNALRSIVRIEPPGAEHLFDEGLVHHHLNKSE